MRKLIAVLFSMICIAFGQTIAVTDEFEQAVKTSNLMINSALGKNDYKEASIQLITLFKQFKGMPAERKPKYAGIVPKYITAFLVRMLWMVIKLYPGNFTTFKGDKKVAKTSIDYATNNVAYFWAKPAL
ncbi:hypothetical protein H7F33_06070 [Pedobacter sp. PAMC26386]|nr:hypothetical protein H7F33_06070 [Pedobacter sp. PAMC26386]